MSRAIGRLRVLLRVLLLRFLDLFFIFFNRFYHGKLPFFPVMVAAPKFVAMPTKALRRSPPYADDQGFHLMQASMRTHGRPASAVPWHSPLESTALLAVALFTEVELPVAPDHSHDHIPLYETHWCLHLDFFLGGIQPSYADDQGFHPMQAPMHTRRPASTVPRHSLLESIVLFLVVSYTKVEPPVTPDHTSA
ncbi:hypothetical protein BHM03_00027012 [Ensete ventricosum]|nr:hypothetical protein BHM03_00027012 [Ensete ventricosum]